MEAVRSNRSHRPGSSLNKVGLSQLMWAHSQIMWAEAKLQSQIIWAQNGDDLVRRPIVLSVKCHQSEG